MKSYQAKTVVEFFKDAFCVDGEVKVLQTEETKNLKITAVVELNDSKRGKFYLGILTDE